MIDSNDIFAYVVIGVVVGVGVIYKEEINSVYIKYENICKCFSYT